MVLNSRANSGLFFPQQGYGEPASLQAGYTAPYRPPERKRRRIEKAGKSNYILESKNGGYRYIYDDQIGKGNPKKHLR